MHSARKTVTSGGLDGRQWPREVGVGSLQQVGTGSTLEERSSGKCWETRFGKFGWGPAAPLAAERFERQMWASAEAASG